MSRPASQKRDVKQPSRSRKRSPARRAKSTRRASYGWLQWWPVVLGIIIAPFAVRAVDILTLTGPWGARFLVPWTFLLHGHNFHLPEVWADHLIEGVMYAQFPFYGLMATLLHRQYRWSTTVAIIVALHLAGFLALAAIEGS